MYVVQWHTIGFCECTDHEFNEYKGLVPIYITETDELRYHIMRPICTLHVCYSIAYTQILSWLEADDYCQENNSSMLDITSHEELSFIKDLVRFLSTPGKHIGTYRQVEGLDLIQTIFTKKLQKICTVNLVLKYTNVIEVNQI